jgi:hypothetical protein
MNLPSSSMKKPNPIPPHDGGGKARASTEEGHQEADRQHHEDAAVQKMGDVEPVAPSCG